MMPIAFVSDNDVDAVRLGGVLERSFSVVFLSSPLDPEVLKRLAPAALVVRAALDAPVWEQVERSQAEDGLPVLALLDQTQVEAAGALIWDDFAVRPWWPSEVIVRLRRLLQGQQAEEDAGILRWGRLVLDPGRHEVRVGTAPVDLTYTEFRLLAFLMTRAGRVATREAIFKDVWGSEFYGGVRTVDVHIRRLRSKLEAENCPYVGTVRNVGYRLVSPRQTEWAE